MKKITCCVIIFLGLVAAVSAYAADRQAETGPAPDTLGPGRSRHFISGAYAAAAQVIHSAEKGNMNAEARLGWMYATGRGMPQDFYKAAKWYYLAAVQGQGGAQFELGLMYNKGQGVPRDFILAYTWLNLSASQAVGDDRDFKARIRDAVASKMTVAQVRLAQQMALAWYKTH